MTPARQRIFGAVFLVIGALFALSAIVVKLLVERQPNSAFWAGILVGASFIVAGTVNFRDAGQRMRVERERESRE